MRRLVLLRHAKAVRPGPAMADFDRGLEPRGRVEAARAARLLADLGLAPDMALISPSQRTRQTWSIVSETLPARAVEFVDTIYDADVRTLLDHAAAHAVAETVLMVGHNPGLKDLARTLMGDGPHDAHAAEALARGLPTSCAAVLGLDGAPTPRAARLIALVVPERDGDD
jgi:phosphohistidine phosphatase